MQPTSFLFDVDSTLVCIESVQEMARMSIQEQPDKARKKALIKELEDITNAGANREIDLSESLARRIALSPISKKHVLQITAEMLENITEGMPEFISALHRHGHSVWILSASIRETILPLCRKLCIPDAHVFTNDAIWNNDILIGFEPSPLLQNDGKSEVVMKLKHGGQITLPTIMIGDGAGDLDVFLSGAADDFFGFGAHAKRPSVMTQAPHFFESVKEMRNYLSI